MIAVFALSVIIKLFAIKGIGGGYKLYPISAQMKYGLC